MSATDENKTEAADAADSPEEREPLETEGSDPEAGEEKDELTTLKEENQFLLDQLQRARAELENFRRRTAENQGVQRQRLTADVFRDLLPLFDDLAKAMEAEDESGEGLQEGVRIIGDKFTHILREYRIEAIEAVGQPFDPEWHEALFQVESADTPAGHVMEEFERGYRLGEQLIRAARVGVAKAPQPPEEAGS